MKVFTLTLMSTATFAALGLTACGPKAPKEADSITQETLGQPVGLMKMDVNENPLDLTVCDPFNETPAASLDKGVKATLYPALPGVTMGTSQNYIQFIAPSAQKIFFADLNVPTRMFDQGFATETHDVLTDDAGQKLIENFGLKFETNVKLSSTDTEGSYEFGILSDDGSTLKSLDGTKETLLIDNDGEHPTRMGCSSKLVNMKKDTTLPIVLTYYQGPRYHIANILMWRKVSKAGQDVLCGTTGNETFFDPNKNSLPQKAFKDLQARGWKVLNEDNFYLTSKTKYNPCVEGTKPVITRFAVSEVFLTAVSLGWATDIPSTSQVKLINKATGEIILTQADNATYLDHRVRVEGLQPETTYTAQATSISGDFGHSMSDIIEFTTP